MTHRQAATRLVALAVLVAAPACGGGGFDKPLTLSGRVVEPATLERGRDLFNRFCATCHGMDGRAETSQARALDPRPRDLTAAHFKHKASPGDTLPTDEELGRVIRNGVPGTGMPAWGNLDGTDLDAVIQYIKTFSPRWQAGTGAWAPAHAPERAAWAAPASIGAGHRPMGGAPSEYPTASRFVLPARNDAVSFRAAFARRPDEVSVAAGSTGCQAALLAPLGAER